MNVTLWLEITIAGAVYLLAVLFWVLVSLRLSDDQLSILSRHLKEYLPYMAVGFAAASYVVGILAHRIIQLTPRRLLKGILPFVHPKTEAYIAGERTNMVRIWQYGSERLHRELDFQYGLVALTRSLIFSIPFLSAGVVGWLYTSTREGTWQTVTLSILMWMACLLAGRRQWLNYFYTEKVAAEALKPLEERAVKESKADEKNDGSSVVGEAPNS